MIGIVLATEGGTAALVAAVVFCPLPLVSLLTQVRLPLLGVMLNGTASVLSRTVPELAPAEAIKRAFALPCPAA